MINPGNFGKMPMMYRGTDYKIYCELLDSTTKQPINYVGSTFSAILIDQQDTDFTILATFSLTSNTSLTASTATIEFKLDQIQTTCITENVSYFRMFQEENGEKFLYAIGELDIGI